MLERASRSGRGGSDVGAQWWRGRLVLRAAVRGWKRPSLGVFSQGPREPDEGIRTLPPRARAWVVLIGFAGLVAAALSARHGAWSAETVTLACGLGIAAELSRRAGRDVGTGQNVTLSMHSVIVTAGAVALPLRGVLLMTLTTLVVQALSFQLYKAVFNAAAQHLVLVVGLLLAGAVAGVRVDDPLNAGAGARLVLACVVLYLMIKLQDLVTWVAVRLIAPGEHMVLVPQPIKDAALGSLGIALGLACGQAPGIVVFLVPPLVFMHPLLHYSHVLDASRREPKTGLLNAARFRELAEEHLRHSARARTPSSLLVVDLDHLRTINNRFGHLVGDHIILTVADVLRQATRPRDLVCRFGGDEFLILLEGADAQQAVAIAERIRAAVSNTPVPLASPDDPADGPGVMHLSVSIGVVTTDGHGDLKALIESADVAVYRAKAAGRDRVSVA